MYKIDFKKLVELVNEKTYLHETDTEVSSKNLNSKAILLLRKKGLEILDKSKDTDVIDKEQLLNYYALLRPVATWTYFTKEGAANLSAEHRTLKEELFPGVEQLPQDVKKDLKRRNNEIDSIPDPRLQNAVKTVCAATRWSLRSKSNNNNNNSNDTNLAPNSIKKPKMSSSHSSDE
jgi:hypothetical protein